MLGGSVLPDRSEGCESPLLFFLLPHDLPGVTQGRSSSLQSHRIAFEVVKGNWVPSGSELGALLPL